MAERCGWCGTEPIYVDYHDTEWGVPERDGRALWEKLILDGFQAGLSWITILKKREAFRAAFAGFGTACVVEVLGYYIPWLDHALDTVATPAAFVAGTVATASHLGDFHPAIGWGTAMIAGGGMALSV